MSVETPRIVGCATACLLALSATDAGAQTKFTPAIQLSGIYLDNLFLSPGSTTTAYAGEVLPSIDITHAGPALTASLQYSLQALYFRKYSDLNQSYSQGNANALWTAVSDLLFVQGTSSYGQLAVDPAQPTNTSNLFAVNNITDRWVTSIAPYFKHAFGEVETLARYDYTVSDFLNRPAADSLLLQNSRTGLASARIGTPEESEAPLTWAVSGSDSKTTFVQALPFEVQRVAVDGGVTVTKSIRLLGTAGRETNALIDTTRGGLNATLWSAGLKWQPDAMHSLELDAGHRYFGRSYGMQWMRNSRLLQLQAKYSEDAQTVGELGTLTSAPLAQGAANPVSTVPAPSGTDTTTSAAIADNGGVGFVRASFQPFLNKEFDLSMGLTGQRTTIQLTGVSTRRQYLAANGVAGAADKYLSARLSLSRKMTARDTVVASAMYERADLREGLSYHGWLYALGMTHDLTPKLTASLTGTHLQRSGDLNYAANVVALTLKQSF